MRKRTIKNVFENVFWHVVYFFPIIAGLLCMLLFTTDSYADYLTNKTDNIVTWLNVGDTLHFNDRLTGFDEVFQAYDNDVLFSLDIPYSYYLNSNFSENHHIYFEFFGTSDSYESRFVLFDVVYLYYSDSPEKNEWIYDSSEWSNHQITITGELERYDETIFNFIVANTTLVNTEGVGSVAELMYDAFDSVFDVVGYDWSSDLVYTTVDDIFGLNGIFPVFRANSVIIKFLCYYFYVNILHLLIDFLLFIPKLCHKLLDNANRGEQYEKDK